MLGQIASGGAFRRISTDVREDLFGDVDEQLDRMGGELHTSEQALQGVLGILEADGSTTITPPTC